MFENLRRGRQARNFTTNVPKILDLISSSEQIFSENWRWVPMLLRWVWILPHLDIETFFFYFQVSAIQEEANRLQGSYAGDKAKEIQAKEDEVVDAWKRLNWRVKQRTERLHDADDLYRFLLAVQDQMLWMNDMLKQILTYEKAKWVSLPYYSPLFWDRYWSGPISHLPIFRLALLTVPESFVLVF